jgi:hypothetical protein
MKTIGALLSIRNCFVLVTALLTYPIAWSQLTLTDARNGCKVRMLRMGSPPPVVAWDGACEDGFASGSGDLTINQNEVIYKGQMRDGWRHGYGAIRYIDGSSYVGEFSNSLFHGQGKFQSPKGSIEGRFVNDKANGPCVITFFESVTRKVSGTCVNDDIQGYGQIDWSNGNSYTGELKQSNVNGRGVYLEVGGIRSEGVFVGGKLSDGKITYLNGNYRLVANGLTSDLTSASGQILTQAATVEVPGKTLRPCPNVKPGQIIDLLVTECEKPKVREQNSSSAALTDAEGRECIATITSLQLASQRWAGTPAEIGARLGYEQKEFFTRTRCRLHPQAAGYIAGADRMLASANSGTSGSSNSRSSDDKRYYRPFNECGSIGSNKYGTSKLKNNCNRSLAFHFTGGMVNISAFGEYTNQYGSGVVVKAICEHNHGFDDSRGLCRP